MANELYRSQVIVDLGWKRSTLTFFWIAANLLLEDGYHVAQGINNKDQIVGFYLSATIGAPIYHGFLYSGGQYITLDDPSSNLNKVGSSGSAVSNTGTVAMGINNKGNIVGYYYFDNSDRAKGFIFSNGN